MSELKDKSIANAKKIEARRACEPHIDPVRAMAKAWEGPSNSGTDQITPAKLKPKVTLKETILVAVERAMNKYKKENKPLPDVLTLEARKEIAEQYREAADRLNRG